MRETLTMLPEGTARRLLGAGVELSFTVLRPPYPALGIGTLRVLRLRERTPERLELTVGYDRYERLA
jgi:hypothetical protein